MSSQKKPARGEHLYIVQSDKTGAIKIGRSGRVDARVRELQTGSPYRLKLLVTVPERGDLEKELHEWLAPFRIRRYDGEWFSYESLGSLPTWLYEMMPLEEMHDWWQEKVLEEKETNVIPFPSKTVDVA